MPALNSFKKALTNVNEVNFDTFAIDLFKYQAKLNPVYASYLDFLGVDPDTIGEICDIPFLPIEFFKEHKVVTGDWIPERQFLSSGTTSQQRSVHYVEDVGFYRRMAGMAFEQSYGYISEKAFLALLPSYVEQGDSSLVDMVAYFIGQSNHKESGFYLEKDDRLLRVVDDLLHRGVEVILFGVAYALLDLSDRRKVDWEGITIIETGGMKGRREEITKEELYARIGNSFNISTIHSEYGMTELLSQAYASRDAIFKTPPWMKVMLRDLNDPFNYVTEGKNGGVNVIDLANIHSCAFIETKDIGTILGENKFKVLGRFDNADIRGCNLLIV